MRRSTGSSWNYSIRWLKLLGEEEISLEEFARILDAGYEAADVGIIPPGYDRVVFGDIERSRLNEIKVLFLQA